MFQLDLESAGIAKRMNVYSVQRMANIVINTKKAKIMVVNWKSDKG
ncbi:hypothetical protein RUMHYD_01918 [Blautia hydrogenotrophica DSM 10507]|uniref:Uncharacterized protein n=1 Tax=Blautia hydrogenotrophica (strain DSM 10507 / JCM 14656 / S5a33) TaxID=476272 RepID=C0CM42_BLAHS|nr:hypothetical protein RUMHYD_01918 [Blautia hydrogenotrophica DSM 10507]